MADDSKYPTRIAPYGLRMPPDLKERIQEAADKAGRSLHAELIHTLQERYPKPKSDLDRAMEKVVLGLVTRKDEDIRTAVKALIEASAFQSDAKENAVRDAIMSRVMALQSLSDELGRRKFSLKELSDAGLIDPEDASPSD